ncbi:hypothetical protein H310_01016 [Aphanomyces invadans]|uniref:Uncharacterized protein n=1 Tax=Aphanomyces invadans TaxID=157072 RepID=A0A024UQ92_9STRA|nr:hypothetical protein H310_01016 [Aphanomyces invadans]ETW08434.1 hypothetical protein H310_01016 [Aphanomyces invadans]|eukprot:XP_008862239.1 hypothetical protein H310_01016 [Aphanomyces invadans]
MGALDGSAVDYSMPLVSKSSHVTMEAVSRRSRCASAQGTTTTEEAWLGGTGAVTWWGCTGLRGQAGTTHKLWMEATTSLPGRGDGNTAGSRGLSQAAQTKLNAAASGWARSCSVECTGASASAWQCIRGIALSAPC